ncbi:cytochrome c oxidase assembly factor CtaG [Ectobacillus antri]|uniref:cytochrome c oxidase assembly factor CtaG n=1 Tax=Ectobacillus antri TaxID=2486280 RepID=UPI000F5949B2|nr:cytochrome c oxidase assembly factor CtaG [Ectobacillus antri]
MSNLWVFGFEALWSPVFFIFIAAITVVYFLIIGRYNSWFPNAEKVSKRQQIYFVSGMILLYTVKGGPLDLLGHISFSAHMTEMAILFIAVPPLLILGIPQWLLAYALNYQPVRATVNIFAKPLIALFVFNGLFSLYHLPFVFDVVKQSQLLHPITLAILFFMAIMMWWPVLNPLPQMQTLSEIQKIGYIFANGMLLTPACALIIFASKPLFLTYTDPQAWLKAMELCVPAGTLSSLQLSGPEFLNWLPPLEDQRTGGIVMKIVQELVYGTLIGYVFFRWVRQEKEKEKSGVYDMPPYVGSE